MGRKKQIILVLIIGIFLSVPFFIPYLNKNYFPTHDGEWAVVRAAEMFRELKDLQLPPRFSHALNFGYGYPLFNFAYPGPYFITTIIHAGGFSFLDSVKILFALSIPISFFGMYLFSKSFFKNTYAGIVSGVLYLYAPYRMVDLYVRGSIGESLAFALYPWIFYCLFQITQDKKKMKYVVFSAILVAALITMHNIMSVYFGILFLAFVIPLLLSGKVKEVLFMVGSIIWGAVLSAFFIVPALLEKNNILLSKTPIADRNLYFVSVQKLLFSSWGFGTPTESNAFSYQIGLPQILGVVITAFTFKKIKKLEHGIIVSFLVTFAILILMMFPFSAFLWKLPLLSEINYPWTLLLPVTFLASFLTGGIIFLKKGMWIGIFLSIFAIILYFQHIRPSGYIARDDLYYITNEATTTSSQELMPLWVKEKPVKRFDEKIIIDSENGYVDDIAYDSKKIMFTATLKNPGIIIVNTIYYPGWTAYTGSAKLPINYDNPKGLMDLSLPAGQNRVAMYFTETPMRMIANIVSILAVISIISTIFTLVFLKLKRKYK